MVSTSGLVSCVVSFGTGHGVREVAVWKGAVTMMNDERLAELQQAEDMAYFRADRATRSRLMQYHYDTKGVM